MNCTIEMNLFKFKQNISSKSCRQFYICNDICVIRSFGVSIDNGMSSLHMGDNGEAFNFIVASNWSAHFISEWDHFSHLIPWSDLCCGKRWCFSANWTFGNRQRRHIIQMHLVIRLCLRFSFFPLLEGKRIEEICLF